MVNENGESFIPLGNFNRRGISFVGANMVNNYAGGLIADYTGDVLISVPDAGSAFISEFVGGVFTSFIETGLLDRFYNNSFRLVEGITVSRYSDHIRGEIRDVSITGVAEGIIEMSVTALSRRVHPALANLPGMLYGVMGNVPYTFSRRRRNISNIPMTAAVPARRNDWSASYAASHSGESIGTLTGDGHYRVTLHRERY